MSLRTCLGMVSGVAAALALCAGQVRATTQDAAAPATSGPGAAILLSDLLDEDLLGYSCLPVARLDAAFFAEGRGLRLPRTCLPDPCAGALDRSELGALIGRMPFEAEWDDYYARYGEVCRKETTPFPGDAPDDVALAGLADPVEDFWRPFLRREPPGMLGGARIAGPGGPWPQGGGSGPVGGALAPPSGGTSPFSQDEGAPRPLPYDGMPAPVARDTPAGVADAEPPEVAPRPDPPGPDVVITPVPPPPPLWLALSGLALICGLAGAGAGRRPSGRA